VQRRLVAVSVSPLVMAAAPTVPTSVPVSPSAQEEHGSSREPGRAARARTSGFCRSGDAREDGRDTKAAIHGEWTTALMSACTAQSAKQDKWRWRESNPRPMAVKQVFSGRSLLRVSRPQRCHRQLADRPSHLSVQAAPMTKATSSGSLDDASIWSESYPRLTDFRTRSGGENEVGAVGIGTYWFAGSVDEITLHPRPASPGSTTIVETDHPLCSCQAPERPADRTNEQVKRTSQPLG
jgi:hypothetical protein